jgi:alanine dehydrogenase
MAVKLTIGIIREGKVPVDHRVALCPEHVGLLLKKYPGLKVIVQPSPIRCYSEEEYKQVGAEINEDLSSCDLLLGVKEVPISMLMDGKAYLFFSHTIKKQAHNKKLLQAILEKDIRMIDYETLTFDNGRRAVAFGHFAGIVGAHNGLMAYGKRTGSFSLKPAFECEDYADMRAQYASLTFPKMKIAVAGSGRVGSGAVELLNAAGIEMVTPREFLKEEFNYAVYTELRSKDLYKHINPLNDWDNNDFHANPQNYKSRFDKYAKVTDLFINTVFWDIKAPRHFEIADMTKKDFRIKTIADISCDIDGSVPATIRATTIQDPVFGFDPFTKTEVKPYQASAIDIMAVDNLPCELPRDASHEFSHNLVSHVLPNILEHGYEHTMIDRATIAFQGKLNHPYTYLSDYALDKVH